MSIAAADPAPGSASPASWIAGAFRGSLGGARRLAWSHPEWWALALALAAWTLLIASNPTTAVEAGAGAHHHHPQGAQPSIAMGTMHWQLMVVAMMLPVVVPSLRVTAFRSLRRRRHRALAGFLVGYLAVWAIAGVAACSLVAAAPVLTRDGQGRAAAAAGAFLLAALWQSTPLKRRALVACHRTLPLAPSGWRADRDCLVFGGRIGWSCCAGCWPLMVACTLTGHHVLALVACGGIGLVERYSWRPRMRPLAVAMLGLALAFGAPGLG